MSPAVATGATHSPRSSSPGLIRPASQGQLATEQEISHMLQQQHAQLTFKRAASGIMDSVQLPGAHKRHSGNPSTLSAAGGGSLLSSGDGGHQVGGQRGEREGPSGGGSHVWGAENLAGHVASAAVALLLH